jgi:ATP-dependent protease HslVU (ClpYQ) peptidase subunit
MTIKHDSFTLAANTPTIIATIPLNNPTTSIVVTNVDAASVYLGDSSVSTGANVDRGIRVATNTNQQVWLNGGDVLYAISLAGTTAYAVAVLYSPVIPV